MKLSYKIQPWEHQLRSIEEFERRDHFALFYECGTGKTATAIHCARVKYNQKKRILRTLIVCPAIVVEAWRREIIAHAPEAVAQNVICLTGEYLERRVALKTKKPIVITNFESFNNTHMRLLWAAIKRFQPEMIIVDESHKLKDPNSRVSERLRGIADKCNIKMILTGTPVLQDGKDLWAQLRILSPELVGRTFTEFKERHCVNANIRMPLYPKWVIRNSSKPILRQILRDNSHRVTKAQALDLPPLVKQTIFVELTKEQKALYEQLEKDFIAIVNDDTIVASSKLTQLLRLQQVVAGIAATSSGDVPIPSAKLHALNDILESIANNHKVIIWTHFRPTFSEIGCLLKKRKLKFVTIHGDQKPKERQKAIDSFNNDPNVRVCVANQIAGGTGIGLQAASYMIYYSKSYSLEADIQSESRAHRGGSEIHECITRIDLVAQGTVDEKIDEALRNKMNESELLLSFKNFESMRLAA